VEQAPVSVGSSAVAAIVARNRCFKKCIHGFFVGLFLVVGIIALAVYFHDNSPAYYYEGECIKRVLAERIACRKKQGCYIGTCNGGMEYDGDFDSPDGCEVFSNELKECVDNGDCDNECSNMKNAQECFDYCRGANWCENPNCNASKMLQSWLN
jgi:hypothetical protein